MPNSIPTVYVSPSTAEVSQSLCHLIVQLSAESVARHGKFVVALSGGSLPATLGKALQPSTCDFSKWHVLFADERCVPLTHQDSNYRLCNEEVLKKCGVPVDQIYTIDDSVLDDTAEVAKRYQVLLQQKIGDKVEIDAVLLGIGPDGHTCSLFPGHKLLEYTSTSPHADVLVAPIQDSPKPPPKRVTLTYTVLERSRKCVFVATGDGKKETIKRILDDKDHTLPATRVQCKEGVVWFMDNGAASLLKNTKIQRYNDQA